MNSVVPLDSKKAQVLKSHYEMQAKLYYYLPRYGDYLARQEGHKDKKGLNAVHFYLVTKYHWLPSQVSKMSFDDMRFILSEEMSDWSRSDLSSF